MAQGAVSRSAARSSGRHAIIKPFIGTLLALALLALGEPPGVLAQAGTEVLRKEIEDLKAEQAAVRRELAEIKELLRRGQASPQNTAPPRDLLVSVLGAPAMGGRTARLTLVEFSDYQCPFCRQHSTQVLPELAREYVKTGKVRYVFRDFPIASLHPQANRLHEAAHCAGDQGKYWEMHDRLFADPQRAEANDLVAHGRALGLDVHRFERCLADEVYAARVRQGVADGEKARVRGTPTFFLGLTEPDDAPIRPQRLLVGAQPYAAFKQAIDGLLAEPR